MGIYRLRWQQRRLVSGPLDQPLSLDWIDPSSPSVAHMAISEDKVKAPLFTLLSSARQEEETRQHALESL